MVRDYVITVTYANDPTPLVFTYRSRWSLARVKSWAVTRYHYRHVATAVDVRVAAVN